MRARVFIDATYEGDLMALSWCDYRVGRESRSEYGELFAGVKYYQGGKLLIGSTGKGDHKIQCYNYRICASNDPKNFVRIEKPSNYHRKEYLPLLEMIRSGKITAFEDQVVKIRRIPNGKADINDLLYSPVSLRLPGENYRWPEGTWEERREIAQRHKDYSLGLFYFLQNDPEVPVSIKNEVSQWGLPRDEFEEHGHFPPMLYIREGRRLKGNVVLTEHDTQPAEGILRTPVHPDAIAICDYSIDSHGNAPAGNLHPNVTEGVFNRYVQPYQIPYRVILPADVDGLLVSCAVSATHVAFSSLRMEPTWTAIGQAVGIAAAISAKSGKALRGIPVEELQRKLHLQGAKTIYVTDTEPGDTHFTILQYFGTKGFFHELPEHENQPYTGRGSGEGIRGQHIQAYPFHASNHHLPMDSTVAGKWWKMAKLGGEVMAHQGLTRLQFLQELHRRLNQ